MSDPREQEMDHMNDLERGFHNRDGWFFRRDSEDGNVRIWRVRRETPKCTCGHFDHHTLDRNGFQCAAVDARGRFIKTTVAVLDAGPHIIPENEWASIVASVSRGGETGASWQFARDFHNGGCKHE